MGEDLSLLDATAQADLVHSGACTAVELVEAAIARIERLNPELNAVIHPLFDKARHAAASSGLAGTRFAGVPMALKDAVAHSAGDPYHVGMRVLRDLAWTEADDAWLVTRFRAAGLVIVAKTNLPELAMADTTEPQAYGPTRNPWDPTRGTGGSSGGSAAAVAAGIVAVAHANDVGGSIRNPAGNCGLVGLKPSRGRSDLGPDFGDAMGGFAEELVVTRSVSDTALLLRELCRPAPGQWQGQWPLADPVEAVAAGPGRLRIGWTAAHPSVEVDPRIADVVSAVAGLLTELGHDVTDDAPAPLLEEDPTAFALPHYAAGTAWVVDQHWPRILGQPIPDDGIEAGTAMLAAIGRSITAPQLLEARELAQAWTRRLSGWWLDHDVLAVPTLPMLAPEIGTRDPMDDGELIAFLAPFNVSGQPAMSLPLGMVDGIPVGVQLVAAHGREDVLVALGAQLEQAQPWSGHRPAVHVDHA
jgi:amidase